MSAYLFEHADSTQTFNISELAAHYGVSGAQLNKMLLKYGIQFKHNGVWSLYNKYANQGYTITENFDLAKVNGVGKVVKKRLWTQKGRKLIYDTLKENGYVPTMELEEE